MDSQEIANLLEAKKTKPNSWIARCPAHDDRHPSLSIKEASDGRTLLHCFVGCRNVDVLKASGLEWKDLFPGPPPRITPRRVAKVNKEKELRDWKDQKEGEIRRVVHRKNQLIAKGEELLGRSGRGVYGSEIDWGPQGQVDGPTRRRSWRKGMELLQLGYLELTQLEWLLDLLISKHNEDWIEERGFLEA